MLKAIDNLGKYTVDQARSLTSFFLMIYLSFRQTILSRGKNLKPLLSVTISQIYFTGCMAMPLIGFLALATGSIVILQSTHQLSLFGSSDMMGNLLTIIIVRELGPMITALIVIARSGTAVASELGNMQVNKEIDAMKVMSIDPLVYLVFPRLLGGVISVLCLAFYFNIIALGGGFVVASFLKPLSFSFYMDSLARALTHTDFILSVVKNCISGVLIFAIASYVGLKVKQSPHEVPQAATKAVVLSIGFVTLSNVSLTLITYLMGAR